MLQDPAQVEATAVMAEFPALPLWTDAYLGDTTHLTTIEHGAYLLLLMAMWRADGALPDDDKLLARYARLTTGQWARVAVAVRPFFRVADGKITQGRLTDELTLVRRNSVKQSNNSRARWLKTKETGDPMGMPDVSQLDPPTPTPTPTPKTGQDTIVSLPFSVDLIGTCFDHFNEVAERAGWPKVQARSKPRVAALRQRVKDVGGAEAWMQAIDRAAMSPLLTGQNNRQWAADFDWLAKPANFNKLMEGNYDGNRSQKNPAADHGSARSGAGNGMVAAFAAVAAQRSGRT